MAQNEDLNSLPESGELPPMRMSEIGYNGLKSVAGYIGEECRYDLSFPRSMHTFKKMMEDNLIYTCIDSVQTLMTRAKWEVKAPKGYEEKLAPQVAFLSTCMTDMVHSWATTIRQASSFVHMGFAVHEIVPRYRLKSKGSKYNDGYIGIKKLAFRSQDTITNFKYKNKGRDLVGIWQRVNIPTGKTEQRSVDYTQYNFDGSKSEVLIPLDKCLLFRNNPIKDSPIGQSPLAGVYEAWRYRKAYQEVESNGVSTDVRGLKVLYIPPQYMRPDASDVDKEIYSYYQKIMRNVHLGKESGLILPQVIDNSGEQYFKFDVVSVSGTKTYDIDKIIERYNKEIETALYADFRTVGQSGGGSFALSDSKIAIAKLIIESKLDEIKDVLNHQLIPRLFEWNEWETEVYPYFDYGSIIEETLDEFSKALQRAAATGNVLKTPKNINAIQEKLGLPDRVDEKMSQEDLYELLSSETSKSGKGQEEGMPNGQGSSTGSSGDSSSGNNENA